MATRTPLPTVVIVNYNAGAHLLACLAALERQSTPHRVLVIDNASTDGSLTAAHAAYPALDYLPLRHNTGFARAVNLAARRVRDRDHDRAETLVLLNPDTVPDARFIEHITAPLATNPALAAVAGTLTFADDPATIASAGIVVHRNGVALDARLGTTLPSASDPLPVFGASGGAAAYRLAALIETGGFCEAFFLYLEDVDLAWRLRLRGWDACWASNAIATHAYSASAGEGSPFKRRLISRNRLWTLARCLPADLWRRDAAAILRFDAQAVAAAVARGDGALLRGRAQALAGLPLRLAERTDIHSAASIETEALERWIQPPVSLLHLWRLRRLTARLATTG